MKLWIHWKFGGNWFMWFFLWTMALVLGGKFAHAIWYLLLEPLLYGPGVG